MEHISTTTTESPRAEDASLKGILDALSDRIGPQKFNAWFRHGTSVSLQDDQLKVSVPNSFVANWIEQHYQSDLSTSAAGALGRKVPICVSIEPELSAQCRKRDLDMQAELVTRSTQGRVRKQPPPQPVVLKHRMQDFVVGPNNRLAYTAAMQAARGGGDGQCAQLFVHGPCGVGKTHLLQGICNAVQARTANQPLRWRYVTGEQFTNEFINAVRQKRTSEFRQRYRKLDLLAIDDVHFLAAKRATQDEFLHTFNAIESAGRQVVLASDAHPRMVGDFNEQLLSRFLSGMVVKIDVPEQQTRLEILQRRARARGLEPAEGVLEYIAMHIRGSVRELEGTLVKLSALSALEGGRLSLEMARDALSDHLARTDSAVTLGDIESIVAIFFGITPADIHSSRRTRTVSTARMMAMFLARRHTAMSYPEIGRFMGKNHSSVVLAVQRMEAALEDGKDLQWTAPAGRKSMPAKVLLDLMEGQIR